MSVWFIVCTCNIGVNRLLYLNYKHLWAHAYDSRKNHKISPDDCLHLNKLHPNIGRWRKQTCEQKLRRRDYHSVFAKSTYSAKWNIMKGRDECFPILNVGCGCVCKERLQQAEMMHFRRLKLDGWFILSAIKQRDDKWWDITLWWTHDYTYMQNRVYEIRML